MAFRRKVGKFPYCVELISVRNNPNLMMIKIIILSYSIHLRYSFSTNDVDHLNKEPFKAIVSSRGYSHILNKTLLQLLRLLTQ